MNTASPAGQSSRLASLLDEPAHPPTPPRPPSGPRRDVLREYLAPCGGWLRRHRHMSVGAGAALTLVLALILFLALRPTPRPDFKTAPMDELFNFALLTDDFNNLPIDERLVLIGDLVDRIKNMSAGDSAAMAAFASYVGGKAREQLMKNASKLAIDVWDEYAKDYASVPEDEREDYLDNAFLEFTRMMETIAGQPSDASDAERLAEARRQAERDKQAIRSGRGPSGEQFGRMFQFMRDDVGQFASPQQRSRGQLMMRDMTRRMRGEPLR